MKRIGVLVAIFCLFAGLVWADVVATIIDKAIDQENGSIIIRTQYKIDGVEVISRYPPDAQGRYYWQTRYNLQNFAGMTKVQIKQRIGKDLKQFGEHLIEKKYLSIANPALINSELFDNAVGQSLTVTTASMYVDTNQDGILDTEYVVKSDGSKVEKPYTPPTP